MVRSKAGGYKRRSADTAASDDFREIFTSTLPTEHGIYAIPLRPFVRQAETAASPSRFAREQWRFVFGAFRTYVPTFSSRGFLQFLGSRVTTLVSLSLSPSPSLSLMHYGPGHFSPEMDFHKTRHSRLWLTARASGRARALFLIPSYPPSPQVRQNVCK